MSVATHMIWLPLLVLAYGLVILYWARIAVNEGGTQDGFFSAGHALPAWVGALMLAGASLFIWLLFVGTEQIAQSGFSLPVLLLAGVIVPLPGVIFFKRSWFIAERMRISSQADIFRLYYQSPLLVCFSVAVALLFALGFCGLQVRFLAHLAEALTDGQVSQLGASVFFAAILFAGVGIGGMRSIGYLGVLQTVLAALAVILLAGFSLVYVGGFETLNAKLLAYSLIEGNGHFFEVGKVIDFTAGLGRGGSVAGAQTSLANLSLAFALMGFQASPLAFKLILSTRSANGLAAGQTWVTAGFIGLLVVFAIGLIGASGLVETDLQLLPVLGDIMAQSPWFAAVIFLGLLAGVQLLAGLSLFVAAEGVIRHVYKPYFHSRLTKRKTVMLTRIAIAILAVLAMIMQNIAPVTLSALAALALPLSFQLSTPLLGVVWFGWITRQAAVVGAAFGAFGVILTEPFGYQILSFFGLELPWGRWPWTIHSALWGMALNVTAVLIISAITNRDTLGREARDVRAMLAGLAGNGGGHRTLKSAAWSLTLIWFFLSVGPGLIFGNKAFVAGTQDQPIWLLGMPSLWAWTLGSWICGVGLVWFLAYKLEMASPLKVTIAAYEPVERLKRDQSDREAERLRALIIAGAITFGLAVLTAFSFGS